MREKNFQTPIRAWIQENKKTGVFELKVARGNRFYFSAVREHQINALRAAKHGALVYKIPDSAAGYKPCDIVSFAGTEAYLVIRFSTGNWYLLDIDDFLALKKKQKSIAEHELQKTA